MKRTVEEPVTVDGDRGETITTHPAFGQIVASRVQGYANLYGSDFGHHNYIEIRINKSELKRDLNRDWHYSGHEFISVKLSEAAFATFVSALNVGSGVCCTIDHIDQKPVPALPDPASRVDQFQGEMHERLEKALGRVRKLRSTIGEMGLPKKKEAELQGALDGLIMELNSNLPFVAKSFSEHMEDTIEKAKGEIYGYMVSHIQRAGLEAIAGGKLPLQIEHKEVAE